MPSASRAALPSAHFISSAHRSMGARLAEPPSVSNQGRRSVGIETPCIRICSIDPQTELCAGCRRSLHEIATWARMSPAERRAIMDELPGRALDATGD
jgi:hypothetical protein